MRANSGQYDVLRKVVREHTGERLYRGDMNGRLDALRKRMNRNGEMLDEFVNYVNLENLTATLAVVGCVTRSDRDQEFVKNHVSEG